jgi:hypothetical protein
MEAETGRGREVEEVRHIDIKLISLRRWVSRPIFDRSSDTYTQRLTEWCRRLLLDCFVEGTRRDASS